MAIHIGLDIGGTKFVVAAADTKNNILKRMKALTPKDFKEGLSLLHSMINEVSDGQQILGIGAAIGGPLDWQQGIVSPLHQPEWRNIPLKHLMEREWECPFYVDVDTNVAALGEFHFHHHKVSRLLYLTISTGMGGGLIIDGKIYRGMNDAHPEIAHQSIHFKCSFPERIECECGSPDCLEALVSGNGIRRIYKKSAEDLSENEWQEVTYNISQGIRNLATIYLPDVIALGGGISYGRGEKLIRDIRSFLNQYLKIVPIPQVQLSGLGYDTPLWGAIILAQQGQK